MNGVHDVGGTDGFGPIAPPADEPVFHARWEQRVFSMLVACGLSTDHFRWGVEQIPPLEYLAGRYYEHWLHTVEHGLVEKGVLDAAELEERVRQFREQPGAEPPAGGDAEQAEQFVAAMRAGFSSARPTDAPARFGVGDRV